MDNVTDHNERKPIKVSLPIRERETWWKETLNSKSCGYNDN